MLRDDLLNGRPAALTQLDGVVRRRVLSDRIVRVKVWRSDGRILYSDEPRLIGQHFTLEAAKKQALRSGEVQAELSHLHDAENRFERQFGSRLEVYVGLRATRWSACLFDLPPAAGGHR